MNQLKVFTVDQANEMIPKISTLIDEIRLKREAISKLEVEIDVLELIAEKPTKSSTPHVEKRVEEYHEVVNAFYALIDQIHNLGCFLKDIDLGLIDFYIHHQGRIVYLCWMYGEERAGHWHEIGEGYAARQPIGPEKPTSSSDPSF